MVILLRLAHVIFGALWVSTSILFMFFIKPAIKEIGASGKEFSESLNRKKKFSIIMGSVSLLTLISGVRIYLKVSGGLNSAWILSGPGIGFSIGAISGLAAFFIGGFVFSSIGKKLSTMRKEITDTGGNPIEHQQITISKLQNNLIHAEMLDFVFLVVSITTIATARYWIF